jgi:hypothetical protein
MSSHGRQSLLQGHSRAEAQIALSLEHSRFKRHFALGMVATFW